MFRLYYCHKVIKNLFANAGTFFRMELHPIKIVLMEGRAVWQNIRRLGNGMAANGRVVSMHQINKAVFRHLIKQGRF